MICLQLTDNVGTGPNDPEDETSKAIAGHLIEFLVHEGT